VDRVALGIPPLPIPADTASPVRSDPTSGGPPPELEAYLAQVEALLRRRWLARDLSLERRAAGGQGWVLLQYVIEADGRVRDLALARQSGEPELDRMALASVPARLPRPPPDLAPLRHQVRLRYRNPLLGD
jgi:TonB family protein